MISIDNVYQKVLAFANKEQRGYITPQEFNILANQAQMDLFEQYFYDINQFSRIHGNDTEYSDMLNILEEKISFFDLYFLRLFTPPGKHNLSERLEYQPPLSNVTAALHLCTEDTMTSNPSRDGDLPRFRNSRSVCMHYQ